MLQRAHDGRRVVVIDVEIVVEISESNANFVSVTRLQKTMHDPENTVKAVPTRRANSPVRFVKAC